MHGTGAGGGGIAMAARGRSGSDADPASIGSGITVGRKASTAASASTVAPPAGSWSGKGFCAPADHAASA